MKKKILNKLTYIFGKPLTYVYIFVISFIAGIVCYYFGYKDIVVSESTYNMPNNTSENGFIR